MRYILILTLTLTYMHSACIGHFVQYRDSAVSCIAAATFGIGVVVSAYDGLAGTGYVAAGVTLGALVRATRRLRDVRELARTNDELRSSVAEVEAQLDRLRGENDTLSACSDELRADVAALRGAIGAVGAAGDDLVRRLRHTWQAYAEANAAHDALVRSQYRLHIMRLIQHHDANSTPCSTHTSSRRAARSARLLPHADMDEVRAAAAADGADIETRRACCYQQTLKRELSE